MEMVELSEKSVFTAIDSFEKGLDVKKQIFEWSERLRQLQEEVADLAIELIARYQPVATDLRFIRSCMEIAYGFFRFGRYSYDIVDVLESMGSVAECDKSAVLQMATITREMILLSVKSLQARDRDAAARLYEMDDKVDELYRNYLHGAISPQTIEQKQISEPRCYISSLLILRYLERISDHACYVGDSVYYIVTGTSRPRR
jgi:phosphate transport system protein